MNARERYAGWTSVREGLVSALEMLSDEQLQFRPAEGLRSLGETGVHIAEAEEGWLQYVMTGARDEWPEWYAADYPTVESLKALLAEVHARTDALLDRTDAVRLDRIVKFRSGGEAPVSWIFWHVLEHEIHHRAEIYLMLGLLGLEAPDV